MDKVKISTDELHLFAVEYAFIDKQLNTVGQAMEKFMTGFLKNTGAYRSALRKRKNLTTTTSRLQQLSTGSMTRPVLNSPMYT